MKKNSFIEGTLIATLSIVLVKSMGLLYVIPFYSVVGKQGGALYGYAYNIYSMFIVLSTTGIPIAISKIISEYNTLGYLEAKVRAFKIGKRIVNFTAILSFVILFTFARSIASIIIGDLTGGNTIEDVTVVIRAISFAVLVIPYLSLTRGYLQGHKFITPSSRSQIIEQLVRVSIIIIGSFLTYRVLKLSLTTTVAVAVTGAFFGGLVAVSYLSIKTKKNKEKLGFNYDQKDNITTKEIIRKLAQYTVPYIVLNLGAQLYTFVDMVLVLRTLGHVGYAAPDVEFIASAISTWALKFNLIISSLAVGLAISLIPNIVQSFVKNDWKDVKLKINQTLEMIVVIALPLTIGISFLAEPIWTIFYGYSAVGSSVLRFSIYTALFNTLYLAIIAILQGLNKFKVAYITGIGGFFLNALLDVPLMMLFHKIGLPAYLGAISATVIGYSFSVIFSLKHLKDKHNVSYKPAIKVSVITLIPITCMILVLLGLNIFVPFDAQNKLSSLLTLIIKSTLGGGVYLFISYKIGLLERIFGKSNLERILRKVTFNKFEIGNQNED